MKRFIWIDWMKTIGMFFIIWGHFFSVGHKYAYEFSVPLFFLISGMLSKNEKDNIVFLKKIFWNLFIPMLIVCSIIFIANSYVKYRDGVFEMKDIPLFIYGIFVGKYNSLETCWFVYTLILLKVIFQYVRKSIVLFVLLGVFISIAFYLNNYVFSEIRPVPNALIAVSTAYPWFLLGYLLKDYKEKIDEVNDKSILFGLFFICLIVLYICGKYNGLVYLFIASYGGNMIMYFLGGIAGIIAVFSISKMVEFDININQTISVGSILILGFHTKLILLFTCFIQDRTLLDVFFSLIILIAFVPIIKVCESYFPLILGKYRVKTIS